jgi:hypothetical protein
VDRRDAAMGHKWAHVVLCVHHAGTHSASRERKTEQTPPSRIVGMQLNPGHSVRLGNRLGLWNVGKEQISQVRVQIEQCPH